MTCYASTWRVITHLEGHNNPELVLGGSPGVNVAIIHNLPIGRGYSLVVLCEENIQFFQY